MQRMNRNFSQVVLGSVTSRLSPSLSSFSTLRQNSTQKITLYTQKYAHSAIRKHYRLLGIDNQNIIDNLRTISTTASQNHRQMLTGCKNGLPRYCPSGIGKGTSTKTLYAHHPKTLVFLCYQSIQHRHCLTISTTITLTTICLYLLSLCNDKK